MQKVRCRFADDRLRTERNPQRSRHPFETAALRGSGFTKKYSGRCFVRFVTAQTSGIASRTPGLTLR